MGEVNTTSRLHVTSLLHVTSHTPVRTAALPAGPSPAALAVRHRPSAHALLAPVVEAALNLFDN